MKNNRTSLTFISQTFDIKHLEIDGLYINSELKDTWVKFENDSIASFKKCFIKAVIEKEEICFILTNAFITNIDNEISVKYSGVMKPYKSIKKPNEFIQNAKIELKNLEHAIKNSLAMKDLGLDKKNTKRY
ncbi:MSC_0621 family F1-like ATPase epsilon subunit [Mycoplasma struthionis]|uniref:Uncharacterized protein n=1 Tax=Mycoplasma struthionis TaxID=538220 RepID=A0A502M260_9MOLU|nr:hypothetical protein [Mycoplasma struthionis]TPI02277.1 hypothetical protein FJM01_01255 [Mycoplasma struthionis]